MKEIFYALFKRILFNNVKDFEKELDKSINWEQFIQISKRNNCISYINYYMGEILPQIPQQYLSEYREDKKKRQAIQIDHLKKIKNMFDKNDIQYILVKGFAFSKIINHDFFFRDSHDVDIVIKEKDGEKVMRLLYEHGCLCHIDGQKVRPYPILKNSNMHEYFDLSFNQENSVFEVATTIHGLRDVRYIDLLFESMEEMLIYDQIPIKILNIKHQFIHICTNIYNDEEYRDIFDLRNYYDLILFMALLPKS